MKLSKSVKQFTLALLALAVCGGGVARATPPNGWIYAGNTPGGGYNIVGSAANVGPLGPGTFPTSTTANGFDNITLNLGSVAMSNGNTITITTLSDTLTNNGTIVGGGNGGYGVKWDVTLAPGFFSSLTNNGSIQGANGTSSGGDGVEMVLESCGGNGAGTFVNNGTIIGGNGTSNRGGYAVDFEIYGYGAQGTAAGSLTNNGTLIGGNGTSGEEALYMQVESNKGSSAIGTLINNGNATGGYGSSGDGGTGLDFEIYGDKGIGMGTFINNGSVMGGSGRYGNEGIYYEVDGDFSATGIFTNNGNVSAGNGTTYAGDAAVDMEIYGYKGSATGVFTNNGSLLGGKSGGYQSSGGDGVYFEVDGATTVRSTLINNGVIMGAYSTSGNTSVYRGSGIEWYSGREQSGQNPDVFPTLINNGTIMGATGAGGKNGVYFDSYDTNSLHLDFRNFGSISGGSGVVAGQAGGNGIYLDLTNNVNNVSGGIRNFGYLDGGNGAAGQNAGAGAVVLGNGVTIDNWGMISTGAGLNQDAIKITGNDNTVKLKGHSTTNGLIAATGNNNVLNFQFTGVSPASAAALKAELAPYLTGMPTSGSVTFRGTTINWDPLIVGFNVSSYQLQGLTPNQQSIGANLDSLTYNPAPGTSLFNMLNAIDQSGAVPQALEALSPQPYQIYGDIAEATANGLSLTIDERLNNLRDGSESIDTSGIGGTTDRTTTAGYDKDGKTVVVPEQKSLEKHWGFFAEGSGVFSNIDAHGGDLSNQGFTTSGLTLGVDGKVNDHLVLGGLFDYSYTVADLDNVGSKANVQTLGGGIYAGYHNEGWYGNGLAAWGSNDYNSNRNILIPGFSNSALAETHGNQESINIDGGYDFHLLDNKLTVGPLAGLQYVHLDVNGFNEGGAGAADLAVGGQSVDSFRSRLGVHAQYRTQVCKEVAFATEIRAAWQHEFLDDSRAIGGAFIGSGLGAFSVQTTNPQRDAALVGVGANFTVRDTMTLFFDYDVQAGQESYLEQSVKGGIKLSF